VVTTTHGYARLDAVWLSDYQPIRQPAAPEDESGSPVDENARHLFEERLRFEQLLSDLSAKFVNIPSDRVDAEVSLGLEQIARFLDVDRAILWERSPDDGRLYSNHSWSMPGVEPFAVRVADDDFPWVIERTNRGEPAIIARMEDWPEEAIKEKEWARRTGVKSGLGVPLMAGGSLVSVMALNVFRHERDWPPEMVPRLRLLGEVFLNAKERKRAEEKLQRAFTEIERLKEQLEQENLYLREEIRLEHEHKGIVGKSDAIRNVLGRVEKVAGTESTVLVLGETGTGKELVAYAIHNMSPRKGRALVKVNCGSLPTSLIESELFGRERGAFTGAMSRQVGRFEVADGSTIFLDEIGELAVEVQAKLLRVLEDGEFERLGSNKTIRVDVRVIAATNRDLLSAVRKGGFREDLYYRLNVFPISVPPLRDHREDIPKLVWHFVRVFEKRMGKYIERIPEKDMKALQRYAWPGNIRELRNLVERALILAKGTALHLEFEEARGSVTNEVRTLEEVEKRHIIEVMEETGWRVRGKDGAAEILGIKPTTLESRMEKLGIKRKNR
jgi:transcriptional regulator with GAF, ATPase, and Fis domain